MHDHTLSLEPLADLTDRLPVPYELEAVFDELADQVTELFGLAGSGVSLARNGKLEFHTAYGREVAVVEKAQERIQVGPCVTAFRSGRVVAVNDLATEEDRWPYYCQLAASVGISAVASIPLQLGGRPVGVLDLYGRRRRDWPEADLSAAVVLANMATMFLINASHHRKQVELNEQLQRALDHRVVIEQAKGALAATRNITPDEAFTCLRSFARNNNRTLVGVARAVLEHGLDPA
jgi:GAF domain-containing protein